MQEYKEGLQRYFVSNAEDPKWNEVPKNRILKEVPGVKSIEKGILLPLRLREDIKRKDFAYEGGVCTETFSFAAGDRRNYDVPDINLSCCKSYSVSDEEMVVRQETVVFGGILREHLGDFLTNSTTRLWWFAEHQDTPYKIVFLEEPCDEKTLQQDTPYTLLLKKKAAAQQHNEYITPNRSFLDLLGLTDEKIEIIRKPTQFSRIIVPDEACYILSKASKKWLLPFELIKQHVRERLPASPYKKIYLSRTLFLKDGNSDGVNERYYEQFYERRGYKIIHPETLPLDQQVNVIMGAGEIVCTFGTLSHMALFAENGTKQICILRTPELWIQQLVINAVRQLDWYWFEGTLNLLTTPHDFGVFFYYPTKYFKQFLMVSGTPCTPKEFTTSSSFEELAMQYLLLWVKHFSKPEFFGKVKDKTILDELTCLNRALFDREIDKSLYPETKNKKNIEKQKNEIKNLKHTVNVKHETIQKREKQVREQQYKIKALEDKLHKRQAELQQLKQSHSWRLTRPLRYIGEIIRRLH